MRNDRMRNGEKLEVMGRNESWMRNHCAGRGEKLEVINRGKMILRKRN
jgi:hypothetical protein